MLRVGIAGFGKMGRIRADEILKNKNTTLVAIFEQSDEVYEHNYENVVFCKSYAELLKQKIDIVFICAYNNAAAEYTIKALAKGLHVFCEKPPAKNTKELKEVIKKYKKSKSILKYGFNHRFHYSVMEAQKTIKSKELGKFLWIRGVYGKAGSLDYDKNWRNYKKYSGGGILLDQGIHMLDLMCYFTDGDFDVVSANLKNSYWNIKVEDNAMINLAQDDIMVTMHSSATQWRHKFLLEMEFEKGYINLDGILSNTRSYAPETLVIGKREFEDVTFAMGKPKENITWFENDDSWKLELDDMLNAIKHKKEPKNGTIDDAYRALNLVEKIYKKSGFYEK